MSEFKKKRKNQRVIEINQDGQVVYLALDALKKSPPTPYNVCRHAGQTVPAIDILSNIQKQTLKVKKLESLHFDAGTTPK